MLWWEVTFSLWGLYEQPKSHFLLLKFFSPENHSNYSFTVIYFEIFRMYKVSYVKQSSPTLRYPIKSIRFRKPSIKNCVSGKVSSIFVSNTISMSILLPIYFTSNSNVFLIECILIWSMITLYWFPFLGCLSSLIS